MECSHVKLEHKGQSNLHAYCLGCEWRSPSGWTVAVDATAHAKETGHKVEVEKMLSYIINPFKK